MMGPPHKGKIGRRITQRVALLCALFVTLQEIRLSHAQRPSTIASSPETSALTLRLLQVAWEGSAPPVHLIEDLDGSLDALADRVVDGAMSASSAAPHPSSVAVAKTAVWWATRSDERTISAEDWASLLRGETLTPSLQLCLRASPDPLEEEWTRRHPKLAPLLQRARREGRALIFYDDQELLKHLIKHPRSVALFDEGRLRLFAAPLARLMVTGERPFMVTVWFTPLAHDESKPEPDHEPDKGLKQWLSFLKSGAHLPWLQDLGWRAP